MSQKPIGWKCLDCGTDFGLNAVQPLRYCSQVPPGTKRGPGCYGNCPKCGRDDASFEWILGGEPDPPAPVDPSAKKWRQLSPEEVRKMYSGDNASIEPGPISNEFFRIKRRKSKKR